MTEDVERNILLFATEIKLLELKYGFSLGGDRAGNINICDEDGEKIKTLPNISIKKRRKLAQYKFRGNNEE